MGEQPKKSLARNLGAFFGNVLQGFREDVTPKRTSDRLVLKREVVEDAPVETPSGKVTLRRTVVEEVEIERPMGTEAEDRR